MIGNDTKIVDTGNRMLKGFTAMVLVEAWCCVVACCKTKASKTHIFEFNLNNTIDVVYPFRDG